MKKYHPNTSKLMRLQDEIIKLGFNEKYNKDFCQEIARFSDEMGEDYPSDKAIILAEKWIEEFKTTGKIKDLEYDPEDRLQIYIKNEGGWESLFYAMTSEERRKVFSRLKDEIEKWENNNL